MTGPDVGVFLPTTSRPGDLPGDIAAAARHAEDLGLESVWAVDQLIAGTGSPLIDSTIALSGAAAATTRVRLGFGVMVLPLRPVVWTAKQVASLQHVSGDRVILGVGAGGDRHEASWAAAGVPRRERGRRTDAALRVLPALIAGKPARLPDQPHGPVIQLAPPSAAGTSSPPGWPAAPRAAPRAWSYHSQAATGTARRNSSPTPGPCSGPEAAGARTPGPAPRVACPSRTACSFSFRSLEPAG